MAETPEYSDRKVQGVSRPNVMNTTPGPQSPHTPQQRASHSTFSSPTSGYRTEEDYVILQIGSRNLLAGFAGDSKPCCVLSFGPEGSSRIGDYRHWLPGHEYTPKPRPRTSTWGHDRELWQPDVRMSDINLVEDKLERTIREAYSKHLLIDSKSRKVLLALPSVLPHPLIGTILSTLFNYFQVPSIILLSLPLLSVLAAGQRSGIVVDIGWHETTVTSVYEFRETFQTRTNRAMKRTTLEMGKLLGKTVFLKDRSGYSLNGESGGSENVEEIKLGFDYVEDVTTRLAWCNCRSPSRKGSVYGQGHKEQLHEMDPDQNKSKSLVSENDRVQLLVPNSKSNSLGLHVFSEPVESVLLLDPNIQRSQDDEELSIPFLLYTTLLSLQPDVRASCLSKIMFTGGGSNIPGLKSRVLDEMSRLVHSRGWDPVWVHPNDKITGASYETDGTLAPARGSLVSRPATSSYPDLKDQNTPSQDSAGDTSLPKHDTKTGSVDLRSMEEGSLSVANLKSVATLGPWAGASLAAGLKLRAVVEIDRENFLQSGLVGARNPRDMDISVARARQSLGAGLARGIGGEGTHWTLGLWG